MDALLWLHTILQEEASIIKQEIIFLPKGMMERAIGIVSRAFLPYSSDKFPITGVITTVPSPIICNIRIRFCCLHDHCKKREKTLKFHMES